MKNVYIYGISSSAKPDKIMYVGKTSNPLEERLKQHLNDCQIKKTIPLYEWIRYQIDKGRTIQIECLEKCLEPYAIEKEKHWIETLSHKGKILNVVNNPNNSPLELINKNHTQAKHILELKTLINSTPHLKEIQNLNKELKLKNKEIQHLTDKLKKLELFIEYSLGEKLPPKYKRLP